MSPDSDRAVDDSSPLRGEVGAQRRVRGGSARVKALRANPSDAEGKLWLHLRNRQLGGLKFVRQLAVGPYVADFACREEALIIEVDGGQHSESARDEQRTRYLNAQGYSVLRFWNNEVLTSIAGVHDVIVSVLDNHPSPDCRYAPADLSPEGRGTRGARAATTKQRSGYRDLLTRTGDLPSKDAS